MSTSATCGCCNGAMQPRLIQARAQRRAGRESLTWLLPADFKDDKYDEWVKLEGKDRWSAAFSRWSRRAGSCIGSSDARGRTL